MQSPSAKYQPTSLYRSLVASNAISPTTDHEEGKYIPNFTTISKTYDVRHLDKFLSKNESHQGSPFNSVRSPISPGLSPRTIKESQSQRNIFALVSPKSNESFYMKNDSRFSKINTEEYRLNVLRDFGSKEPANNFNTLALASNIDTHSLENHYAKSLTPFEKKFDPSKIEYADQVEEKLMSPRQRREELEQIKMHQSEFQKWSGRIKDLTKKSRVYKNGFRSGVLALDSPINPNTLLFGEERIKLEEKQNRMKTIDTLRSQIILEKTGTNPAVEVLNRRFDEEAVMPPVRMVERNIKKTVELPYVENWKDSKYRLFGEVYENVYRQKRHYPVKAKGRDWDIITKRVDQVKARENMEQEVSH